MRFLRRPGFGLLTVQCVGAVALIAALPFVPSAGAPLLLVPLGARATAALAPDVIEAGAIVLARGPFGGSLIVRGDATRLRAAFRGAHVLLVAAPPAICGQFG